MKENEGKMTPNWSTQQNKLNPNERFGWRTAQQTNRDGRKNNVKHYSCAVPCSMCRFNGATKPISWGHRLITSFGYSRPELINKYIYNHPKIINDMKKYKNFVFFNLNLEQFFQLNIYYSVGRKCVSGVSNTDDFLSTRNLCTVRFVLHKSHWASLIHNTK